ncbi:MAG: hypothetical protein B6D63_05065 [Candidatus Latescibacteria bacterium 4484_7]|nr:MAG: hypothetical protein B6D63_05065 [Candidatus Latescibacteria bacterium 4484_7]
MPSGAQRKTRPDEIGCVEMSFLGRAFARVVYALDRLFPAVRVGGRGSASDYAEWEFESGKRLIADYHRFLGFLGGKRILDIGCGYGGKTLAYSESGAEAYGVDIVPGNIAGAVEYSKRFPEITPPRFILASADLLPFADSTFDLVIANDSMEHFSNPEKALHEITRVVKEGGYVVLFFTPWSSPLGSHLYDLLKTPWCHLIYPDWLKEELLRIVLDARGERDPSAGAARLMGEYRSELNRITISQFNGIVSRIPDIKNVYREYRPLRFEWLRPFVKLPFVGKFFVNTVVSVLKKKHGP